MTKRQSILLGVVSLVSLLVGTGAVIYPGGSGGTGTIIINNNAVALTNLAQVRSVDIPIGAWWTNGIDTVIGSTITPAQLASATNTGDGAIFSRTNGSGGSIATAGLTNTLRTRFSLPWDWDGGTVQIGVYSMCGATNSSIATNMVFAFRAVAIGPADNATNLNASFGSFVRVTNNVGTNAWVFGQEGITAALTVGNTPSNKKGILWEIQRHGGDGGDTETNFPLFLSQVRVYYRTTSVTNYPTASP
jgi:hypothetical protein